MASAVLEHESELDVLSDALSRTRALRALVNAQGCKSTLTESELSFHLGCAEIALLRLMLEEEHRINSFALEGAPPPFDYDDRRVSAQGEG